MLSTRESSSLMMLFVTVSLMLAYSTLTMDTMALITFLADSLKPSSSAAVSPSAPDTLCTGVVSASP